MDQLRVQHRDLDALRPIQRHRQVQRVDAGRLQRYSHPRLALAQPADQGLVPAGVVVEHTLLEPLIFLMNGCGKSRRTHIDAAKYRGLHGWIRLAHDDSLKVRSVSAAAPVRVNGLALRAALEHAGSKASDSPRRKKRGAGASLRQQAQTKLASGGNGLSAET